MKPVFQIDGIAYHVTVPEDGLKRSGQVLDSDKTGRVQTGRMVRDIIGTYYNYTMQVETRHLDTAQYDALFEALSAPVDYHTVTVPYGQGTLTFEAYVSGVEDTLKRMSGGKNLWGELSVTFTAMAPART